MGHGNRDWAFNGALLLKIPHGKNRLGVSVMSSRNEEEKTESLDHGKSDHFLPLEDVLRFVEACERESENDPNFLSSFCHEEAIEI